MGDPQVLLPGQEQAVQVVILTAIMPLQALVQRLPLLDWQQALILFMLRTVKDVKILCM
ncbi:hypothetical protein D3C86_2013670 [compost metagenome]